MSLQPAKGLQQRLTPTSAAPDPGAVGEGRQRAPGCREPTRPDSPGVQAWGSPTGVSKDMSSPFSLPLCLQANSMAWHPQKNKPSGQAWNKVPSCHFQSYDLEQVPAALLISPVRWRRWSPPRRAPVLIHVTPGFF